MTVIKKLDDLDIILSKFQRKKILGLVPTMGSIHRGHISLIKTALKVSNEVWVSIFVNPTQFNDVNDYKKYPKDVQKDINQIKSLAPNVKIFLPSVYEIYGSNIDKISFNFDGIDKEIDNIIFLDCGSNSHDVINYLKTNNIRTIIIDHHIINNFDIPKSDILINPVKKKTQINDNNVCTATLTFFLVDLINKKINSKFNLNEYFIFCLISFRFRFLFDF